VLNQFQAGVKKVKEKVGAGDSPNEGDQNEGEDATVKTAERVSRGVFHHQLQEDEKKVAGPAVHYAMGAVSGGIYGAVAELVPVTALGAGLPFGAAVWLAADEVAVPALGLSKPPTRTPAVVHAQALASHLVYGLTTDLVRRGLLRVF
jgi:uncharacterized membrane protein YagU involved in acid resistance